jgi:hypothetical protein
VHLPERPEDQGHHHDDIAFPRQGKASRNEIAGIHKPPRALRALGYDKVATFALALGVNDIILID